MNIGKGRALGGSPGKLQPQGLSREDQRMEVGGE